MIDAVRVALTALRTRTEPASGDLHVVALEGARGTFVAIDDRGRPHLLLATVGTHEAPVSDVASMDISTRSLSIGGQTTNLIDVACLFESVAEVFDHFIVAVLERLDRGSLPPPQALSEVLEKWKQFLVPTQGPPGRDRLAAVFGELVLLLDVVRADPARRIDPWVGPFGGRHDIRRATAAMEVKTTRSHTSRKVTIHGEDQLEPPENGTLHLHLVRLEEVPDGEHSVASLADELLAIGVGAEALFEALSAAGVPITDLSATADVAFQLRERLTVPVDDDMARIVPASFVGGARPVGVVDISYVIDLDHSLDRALDEDAFAALLAVLGTGA